MAVLASGAVSRWRELATDELRDRVQQLVAARLDAEHAVWRTIRRDPVLTARVRGVLSGMASSVSGTRDEHMRKVWIAAARTALEGGRPAVAPVRPARVAEPVEPFTVPESVRESVPGSVREPAPKEVPESVPGAAPELAPELPVEPVDDPVRAHADSDHEPAADSSSQTEDAAEEHIHPAFTSVPPPVTPITASPRAPIPPMVFSGP